MTLISHGAAGGGALAAPQTELIAAFGDKIVARKVHGDHDADLIRKITKLGLDESLAAKLISTVISERLETGRKLHRWKRRIEALMDAHRQLRQLHPNAHQIPRISKPDPQEFFEEYYCKGEPVILTGLFDHWPAIEKWSPDYFEDEFGDIGIEVMIGRESDPNYERNRDEHRTTMLLKNFIARIRNGPSNDAYMVAHNFALPGPLSKLAADIREVSGILRLPDNLTDINLWLGPAGTITPLHHDVTNVLLGQFWGEKRLVLYPWSEIHLLYNEIGSYSRFDPEAPDWDQFPLARSATRLEATICRGEAIFIPVGTWHQVRSLSPSISLSMSQFLYPNRYTIHSP